MNTAKMHISHFLLQLGQPMKLRQKFLARLLGQLFLVADLVEKYILFAFLPFLFLLSWNVDTTAAVLAPVL